MNTNQNIFQRSKTYYGYWKVVLVAQRTNGKYRMYLEKE